MKKLVMIFLVVLILISFVSAGLFSDVWSKITGRTVEENATETIVECDENISCASERGEYCEGSNACFSETIYECINGKCVASGGGSGCIPCPYDCQDGVCIGEPTCRDENAECTIEDVPCCAGLKEVPLSFEDSDGNCVAATCGSICRPCGNGICDENENRCNCPEDCKTAIECGEGIGCASEEAIYCEGSNACTKTTIYECIEGKCVASSGGGGCAPCEHGCKNGVCLTKEEPEPRPEPRPEVCAEKISISFDKNVYYVGEEFKVVMEVFDSQGNRIPNYPFYIQIYNYDKGMWHTSFEDDRTDGSGYRIHQGEMKLGEPFRFGKNKFKIYADVGGCNLVEDIAMIEIKRREGPEPVPCGMGSCVPEEDVEEIEVIPDERGFYSCAGCELEGKCYPMGYRKSGEYCSDNYEFVNQAEEGMCDNHFECKSNICVSDECVGEGLIKKIIKWIKKMFGGDEDEEEKPEVDCSKLLLEHNIGEYKYEKSLPPGDNKHMLVPIFSEDGEHIGIIKCCAAVYEGKEDTAHGVLFCAYDSKEDVINSIKWIIAKERDLIFKEFKDKKVFGDDKGQAIGWINNAYLIVVGPGAEEGVSLPEDIVEAYLKKYPSEFELTEDDIPDAPPERPWVYCTEEDEKKGNKCESQAGARLQTDPHPDKDKNCEVYVGCILPYEKCEEITDIKEKEDCYVRVAEMTGDSSVCEKITSDESRRNKCYVKAAETSKNANICKKITEDDIKKMCFELVEVFPWEFCKSEEDMLKEECHFFDDFESGLGNWVFSDARGEPNTAWWSTIAENGNTVFKGTGHNWAVLKGKEWDNYIFKTRFKIIKGAIHFNFRRGEGPFSRYFIGVESDSVSLKKQIDKNFYESDERKRITLDEEWHIIEIKGYGNILNIYIDDELLIKYKDAEDLLLSGGVAFETLDDSEFLIDDVEVKLITEADIIYP